MHTLAVAGQESIKSLGLRDGAWKTVENHTRFGLGFVEDNILEDVDHQLVGDELTLVDICFGHLADLGLAGDMVAEHLAGRYMVEFVFPDKVFALGAFAAAGGTEDYNIHFYLKFYLKTKSLFNNKCYR